MLPVALGGLRLMSLAFLLRDQDDAVIWRRPMKMGVIKQFLKDVEWGDLECLVVDAPPGTGDEPLSVCQIIEDADGAVIVTTPQDVALAAVRKSITSCRRLGLPVHGVVENMSAFTCPHCRKITGIFKTGGGSAWRKKWVCRFSAASRWTRPSVKRAMPGNHTSTPMPGPKRPGSSPGSSGRSSPSAAPGESLRRKDNRWERRV